MFASSSESSDDGDFSLDEFMNGKCDETNDMFGYGIFVIFDKKYRKADKIFERAANKILDLYRQRLLTKRGLNVLSNIVELYSDMYDKFTEEVRINRTYTPKASSGAKKLILLRLKIGQKQS